MEPFLFGRTLEELGMTKDEAEEIIKCTVKPLYSEQSRDPKNVHYTGGVHPRGVRYVHAHMCQKYNVHMYN